MAELASHHTHTHTHLTHYTQVSPFCTLQGACLPFILVPEKSKWQMLVQNFAIAIAVILLKAEFRASERVRICGMSVTNRDTVLSSREPYIDPKPWSSHKCLNVLHPTGIRRVNKSVKLYLNSLWHPLTKFVNLCLARDSIQVKLFQGHTMGRDGFQDFISHKPTIHTQIQFSYTPTILHKLQEASCWSIVAMPRRVHCSC